MNKSLECSTNGDKRYSALYAKITVFDVFESIEVHYQNAKEYLDDEGRFVKASSWKEAKHWQHKGRKPVRLNIQGTILPLDFLSQFYKVLWVKYLDANPGLVEYAKQFDEFTDAYRRENTLNCQADVIRQYVKQGRSSIMKECEPLLQALRGVFVREIPGNLLKAPVNVMGQQVNCKGIMGRGLAKKIRDAYPVVFDEYEIVCKIGHKSRKLMGHCQLVEVEKEKKYVANLFGQFEIGTDRKHTEEHYLKLALQSLKNQAKQQGLSVGLPWKLGCDLSGGSWDVVRPIIQEVFSDYPVTIYRLPHLY